jgi:hypothetical protein
MRDGDFLIMVPMTHSSNQAHDIYPWPRHPKYTDESLWDGVASYDSIYNLTIKLGSYEKNDLVLDKLKVFRYKTP